MSGSKKFIKSGSSYYVFGWLERIELTIVVMA